MAYPEPTPDSLRQWLEMRHETLALKGLAFGAIEAFEHSIAEVPSSRSLRVLTTAAMHPRFVVWDVGLLLLARLGESSDDARACIAELAESGKMEHSRRSIQYITDRYPKSFCKPLLTKLLADRSAKLRGFAACRIERLNLTELIPLLQNAIKNEENTESRFEFESSLALLRDNYYEYENANEYTLIVRCDRVFPPIHWWPRWIAGQPITRENVAAHGIPLAIQEMRRSAGYDAAVAVRRPWCERSDE